MCWILYTISYCWQNVCLCKLPVVCSISFFLLHASFLFCVSYLGFAKPCYKPLYVSVWLLLEHNSDSSYPLLNSTLWLESLGKTKVYILFSTKTSRSRRSISVHEFLSLDFVKYMLYSIFFIFFAWAVFVFLICIASSKYLWTHWVFTHSGYRRLWGLAGVDPDSLYPGGQAHPTLSCFSNNRKRSSCCRC